MGEQYEMKKLTKRPVPSEAFSLKSLDENWSHLISQLQGRSFLESRDSTDSPYCRGRDSHFSKFGEEEQISRDEFDGRGTFQKEELRMQLRSMKRQELQDNYGLTFHKINEILRRADTKKTGEIEYFTFLKVIQDYRLNTEHTTNLKKIVRIFAYAEEFSCTPPCLFMLGITLIELAVFLYHAIHLSERHDQQMTWSGPVPYCSILIYNPRRRWEAWRFITYMMVHIGISHFLFNMIIQLIVGVSLEMEQEGWIGSVKVFIVYLAGVISGSIGTSLSESRSYIAGASGGVYALIAAHLATLALNWHEDSAVRLPKLVQHALVRTLRLIFISILTIHDLSYAIYIKYSDEKSNTGFMGHLSGALAGLLVGIYILDNRRVKKWEIIIQRISFSIFITLILLGISWNIFGNKLIKDYFPKQDFEPFYDSNSCKHLDL